MLSDRSIAAMIAKGEIRIWVYPNASLPDISSVQFQPVSVDLRLGGVRDFESGSHVIHPEGEHEYLLKPGEFVLGCTAEYVRLSNNLVGMVHGKSTRARSGLSVHAAGLVDSGFYGQLTLEMYNMSPWDIELEYGMTICQISFDFLSTSPDRPYGHPELGSHYQGQTGPTPARR